MKKRNFKIAILIQAASYLWHVDTTDDEDRVPNVCWAIDEAWMDFRADLVPEHKSKKTTRRIKKFDKAHKELTRDIVTSLEGNRYVSGWLQDQGIEVLEYAESALHLTDPTSVKLIAYRQAWVKDMIETLMSGGSLRR